MRIECIIEEHTDVYIDVSETWTRGEYRQLTMVNGLDEYLEWFRRKVTGVRLTLADGTVITDPQAVTMALLDQMPLVLTGFVERALYQATGNLRSLGNASGRVSLITSATKIPALSPTAS